MIISINWLKKFTDIDVPVDELATLIGARLVEIEEVIDYGAKYKDVIVAKVMECKALEGSDHLNVTKLDDGGKVADVERDENGYVQVVCGAPNVHEGLVVAWLPPKSVVPETYGNSEPFVLDARKLRGVMSNGMIASPRELALFDEHEGILELDANLKPGASFAESYELNDYLLDIENKSLTHRPDAFGIIGFAREVAAIQGKAFHTPEWLANVTPDFGPKQGDVTAPTVTIEDESLCDRYQAVVLSGADGAAKSPLWLQTYLARVGIRPISAVVDVTNYLMVLTGQPLHAFDYDKLIAAGGGKADIHVRAGRTGETLELLDGRRIALTHDDIVIAAGDTAIGLAGAMGGANTEIDATTKNIIIESATFNLYNLRGTQMRHGIFSEAITRFTKGQPAALAAPVLADAVRLMGEYA
ncbi:MAG TPA: phenylalanine--tRNA ligase subunit beta, partial [Candidatus Saccharimonadales bacterium]